LIVIKDNQNENIEVDAEITAVNIKVFYQGDDLIFD